MELITQKNPLNQTLSTTRIARHDDFSRIIDLSESVGVFTDDELESLLVDLNTCDDGAGDKIYVSESADKQVTGFIQLSPAPITRGSWYVYWIAVHKDAHGQGIGSNMLSAAERAIKAEGGRQIIIETSASPLFASARKLYLKVGYKLVAKVPDYYADGDDKCIYLKRL
jgi:ribosomal protein S18 acetylase RimI-like enzyme